MTTFTAALKSWVSATFPTKANNLSDLASAATARTNLGLGDAATKATGTTAGTVAAGDDPRITGAQSAAGLDAAVAAGIINSASATNSALSSTFDALPEAYIDPRGMANGAITSLTRGTLVASYGNSPASISSGQIVHAQAGVTIHAAYIETLLSGPVARIGMVVDFDGNTGTVALITPTASWASAIGNGGVHATLTQAGVVACGRYVSSSLTVIQTARVGTLTGRHTFEVAVDAAQQEVTVYLDGVELIRYVDATTFTYVGNRAIWELYEANPDTPATIVSAWADVERVIPPTPAATRIPPIRKAYAATFDPGVYTSYPIGTTYGAVIGFGTLSAVVPPSGKMLVRYRCYVESSSGAIIGSITGGGDQQLAASGYVGGITCEVVYTGGTPGTTVTLAPKMWTASGSASVGVGGARGVATMSATPLA